MRRINFSFIDNVPEGARPYLRGPVREWIDRDEYPVCAIDLPNGETVDLCRRWDREHQAWTVGAERECDELLLLKFIDERHKWRRPPIFDIVAEMKDIDAIASLGGQCGTRAVAHAFSTFVLTVTWAILLPEIMFASFVPAYWLWRRCLDIRTCSDRILEIKLAPDIDYTEFLATEGFTR